jgi:biopolymer transport protein ExbB
MLIDLPGSGESRLRLGFVAAAALAAAWALAPDRAAASPEGPKTPAEKRAAKKAGKSPAAAKDADEAATGAPVADESEPQPTTAPAEREITTTTEEWLTKVRKGGWTIVALLVLSVIGVAFVLERLFMLRRSRIVPKGLSAAVDELWGADYLAGAEQDERAGRFAAELGAAAKAGGAGDPPGGGAASAPAEAYGLCVAGHPREAWRALRGAVAADELASAASGVALRAAREGAEGHARGLLEELRTHQMVARTEESPSVLGRVLAFVATHRHASAADVSAATGDISSREIRRHLQRAYPLAVVATLSPLLGLLGTVIGMIEAFDVVVLVGMGDAQALAGGISKALITTMVGLTIAIPALFAYHAFKSRTNLFALTLEEEVTELISDHLMGRAAAAPGSGEPRPKEAAHAG